MSRRKRDRTPKVSLRRAVGDGLRHALDDARQQRASGQPRRTPLVRSTFEAMNDSLVDQLPDDQAADAGLRPSTLRRWLAAVTLGLVGGVGLALSVTRQPAEPPAVAALVAGLLLLAAALLAAMVHAVRTDPTRWALTWRAKREAGDR